MTLLSQHKNTKSFFEMKKVCVIGAGPCGMNVLAELKKVPGVELVCYEKQDLPGGLWNYSWMTGVDSHGEPQHCGMYRDMCTNTPKECVELPEYTFQEHFGKPLPSFPPRAVLLDYLRGYWKSIGVPEDAIETGNSVREVEYCEESKKFNVKSVDLKSRNVVSKRFDYVVVATGHYSTPNTPSFEGFDTFPGRILHAHDFRSADEFKNRRVLVVGSSWSANDIALQCHKCKAKSVAFSSRSPLMPFKWPESFKKFPLLAKVNGSNCVFTDDSSAEFDAIVLCTGYKYNFPFMPESMRLKSDNLFYPPNLYRGLQWMPGSGEGKRDCGGRLFYMGMQNQAYTFTMFMVQSKWVAGCVAGKIPMPRREDREREVGEWFAHNADLVDAHTVMTSQTKYLQTLAADVGYRGNFDGYHFFMDLMEHKAESMVTYRDKCHTSLHSGLTATPPKTPWMEFFDYSVKGFCDNC